MRSRQASDPISRLVLEPAGSLRIDRNILSSLDIWIPRILCPMTQSKWRLDRDNTSHRSCLP